MFTSILFFAFAAFIFKPYPVMEPAPDKMKCCSKTASKQHQSGPEKKDCGKSTCNMLSCTFCINYMPASAEIHIAVLRCAGAALLSFNDNRLYFNSSDCWHPPKPAASYAA